MDAVRLYCRYVGVSVRAQMQYPASFVMMTIGMFAVTAVEFAWVWALFSRFGTLQGWALPEVALLYGMVHIAFAVAEAAARGFDIFHRQVRGGDFDRILVRPRSTVLQVIGMEFQLMRVGRLAQALLVLVWAVAALGVRLTLGRALLLVASILGGGFLFAGLFVLQATLSFWSVESLEMVNMATYGGVEAGQFPLSIYRPSFRNFFLFVIPLATVNYLPALAIAGKTDPLGFPVWLQWASPLIGILFFLMSLLVWQVGVRHYTSTGS
ncbi:MAG: ABC-2 family transporter protein [bacterium]|nr:ABC-2 family transporter protein [bacterium]